MLFTIFETNITVNNIKSKEKILLNNCVVDYDNIVTPKLSDTNRFKFRILVPTTKVSVEKGGKYTEHVFGLNSEELQKEWIFVL